MSKIKSLQEVERIDHICETCDLYEERFLGILEKNSKKCMS